MDAQLVSRLAHWDPEHSDPNDRLRHVARQVYLNPAFGWEIAATAARARVRFPEIVIDRNRWLFQAYLRHLGSGVGYDPDVDAAFRLSRDPVSAKLKAMLIAGLGDPVDSHLDIVAARSGLSRRTLEAFEILFFNVLDRHEDDLYLSNLVYPKGRGVEFDETYFETTPVADLLLRAAYNHRDIDLIVHLSGMGDTSAIDALGELRDREAQLEEKFMAAGLLMARVSPNQPSVALDRAFSMVAARMSSYKRQSPIPEFSEVILDSSELAAAIASSTPITEDERKPAHAAIIPRVGYCSEDNDEVIAVEDWFQYYGSTMILAKKPRNPAKKSAIPAKELAIPTKESAIPANESAIPAKESAMPAKESAMPAKESAMPANKAGAIEYYPNPIKGIWRNKDDDKPVSLIGLMSDPKYPEAYYLTSENSGIPVSEVVFLEKMTASALGLDQSDFARTHPPALPVRVENAEVRREDRNG